MEDAMARLQCSMLLLLGGLLAATPGAAAEPVKLALFPFELDDFSAAVTGETDADRAELAAITDQIGELLVQSSRYQLVDVASADAPALKDQDLRDCNGCDAAIAQQLGAAQSLVGVVKRISRTEYQVRFQLRDAASAKVLAEADTGLRMGALDSWSRGAKRLIKDRLLAGPMPQ
jgi:hypothetical protein